MSVRTIDKRRETAAKNWEKETGGRFVALGREIGGIVAPFVGQIIGGLTELDVAAVPLLRDLHVVLGRVAELYDENKGMECFFVLVSACIISVYNCFCFFCELFTEFCPLSRRRQIGLKTTTK